MVTPSRKNQAAIKRAKPPVLRGVAATIASLALALTGTDGHAKPDDLSPEAAADYLAEVGTWRFEARVKGPDGKPECVETWHFDADKTGWVQSGEQRVKLTWRTAQGDRTDRWLYRTSISSSAGKDCLGREANPEDYPRKETGFVVMFFNSGRGLTCRPAAYIKNKDGTLSDRRILRDEDCWGSIDPVLAS